MKKCHCRILRKLRLFRTLKLAPKPIQTKQTRGCKKMQFIVSNADYIITDFNVIRITSNCNAERQLQLPV